MKSKHSSRSIHEGESFGLQTLCVALGSIKMNGALVNVYGCHLGPPADRMVLSAISLSGIVKKAESAPPIGGTPSPTPPHPDLNRNVRSQHSSPDIIHTLCRSFRDNSKVRGYFRSPWASRKVSLNVVDLWVWALALFKKCSVCQKIKAHISNASPVSRRSDPEPSVHQVSHWLLRDMHECIYRSRRRGGGGGKKKNAPDRSRTIL